MLARLDSAIASLMEHKDDQKEAQRREDGCAAEDRGGSPQQAVEEACSVRLGRRELNCTLAGKAAGRCASAAGDASGNTGARRTRGEGNAGTGRTCPSSGAVPLERMAFRVFFLLLAISCRSSREFDDCPATTSSAILRGVDGVSGFLGDISRSGGQSTALVVSSFQTVRARAVARFDPYQPPP